MYIFNCNLCANETTGAKHSLKIRKSRMCRKCSNLKKLEKARVVGDCNRSRPYESLYNKVRSAAHRKEIFIDLTYEQFCEFTVHDKCHYCLEDLTWAKYNEKKNGYRTNLDRKECDMGYTENNIVPCCWKCNEAKGRRYTHDEWFGMCKYFRDLKTTLQISTDML